MKWRLVAATGRQDVEVEVMADGNHVIRSAPNVFKFKMVGRMPAIVVSSLGHNPTLLVYRMADGITGQIVSANGHDVTSQLKQEQWEDVYAGALAAVAMLGRVPENYTKEII